MSDASTELRRVVAAGDARPAPPAAAAPASTVVAYEVLPQTAVHLTNVGRLDLAEPAAQARRVKDCFVAYLVLAGELTLVDHLPEGREEIRIAAGELHVVAPGIAQASARPSAPGTRMIWLHFSFCAAPPIRALAPGEVAAAIAAGRDGPTPWLIPRHLRLGRDAGRLLALAGELDAFVRRYGVGDRASHQVAGHLVAALHDVVVQRTLSGCAEGRTPPQRAHVERAQNFIRMNFDRRIPLAAVARAVGLSPAYLSRSFRAVAGEGVVEFLWRTRIAAAKALLLEQAMPSVRDVARRTGFSSAVYFCRIFRRLERMTPLEYVERAGAGWSAR